MVGRHVTVVAADSDGEEIVRATVTSSVPPVVEIADSLPGTVVHVAAEINTVLDHDFWWIPTTPDGPGGPGTP